MTTPRFLSGFDNRRRRLWVVLWTFVLVCCAPKLALAAAPMCDPSGASVAAPVPALPSRTGELDAPKPCDTSSSDGLQVGHSHHNTPVVQGASEVPERVIVAPQSLPSQKGERVQRPEQTERVLRPGFTTPVYRPPRPCAGV